MATYQSDCPGGVLTIVKHDNDEFQLRCSIQALVVTTRDDMQPGLANLTYAETMQIGGLIVGLCAAAFGWYLLRRMFLG
jgi:hypothetical protein